MDASIWELVGGHIFMVDMFSPPKFNVNKVYISFAWNKAHGDKVVNEGSQWVKDMKRRGQKEHSKEGDKQNKFIYYNKTDIDT